MEEGRSAFEILTGKPTGKRTLGRPRRGWEDNIKMDLKETSINVRNWVDSAQDRHSCECEIEPPGSISHRVSYTVLAFAYFCFIVVSFRHNVREQRKI